MTFSTYIRPNQLRGFLTCIGLIFGSSNSRPPAPAETASFDTTPTVVVPVLWCTYDTAPVYTMVFQVHSISQKRKYFANTCSCAGCIAIIAAILAVFLPALIAGIAGDVWQKDKLLWLQPDVLFTKDVIVTLHGSQSGATWVQTLSSSGAVNEVLGVDRTLSIRVCELGMC